MTDNKPSCTTCGRFTQTLNAAKFTCPRCGENEIVRCGRCRKQGNLYECEVCEFMGP